jgi:hypothetical protein
MAFAIKVGPPQLTVHQGYTVMVSDPDGQIPDVDKNGLFFLDTRLICVWTLFADGVPWTLLNGAPVAGSAARVFCTNAEIPTASGTIPKETLGLAFGRGIDGGMHEDFEITNHASNAVCFSLELVVRSDFADIFEVKGKAVTRRGEIKVEWSSSDQALTTTYQNRDFSRAVRIRAETVGSPMTYANGRMSFKVELEPGARWTACLLYDFADGSDWSTAPTQHIDDKAGAEAMSATRRSTICQRCGCRWKGPITLSSCRRRVCRGSWRCSAAIVL